MALAREVTVDAATPNRRQLAVLVALGTGGALMTAPFVDELADLNTRLRELVHAYEDIPLTESLPRLEGMHAEAIRMSGRRIAPAQRKALNSTASRVGALCADALFNTGRVDQARRLVAAAYRHGRDAGDPLAVGYARKVAAMVELNEGQPGPALSLVVDGQRRAPATPVATAALALEARAVAALPGGKPDDVARLADRAIDQAFDLPAVQRGSVGGEDPDAVHPVEITYHALIAAAIVGNYRASMDYADLALPALTAMDRPGFVAVALAHLALADARRGEIDAAVDRVGVALDLAPRPFRAVGRPIGATLAVLRADHARADSVQALAGWARTWRQAESAA